MERGEYLAWCIYWWPTKMRPCFKPGGKWRPYQRLLSDPYTWAMHVSAHIHIYQHEHTHTHTIFKNASLDELFLFWMHLQITGKKIKLSSVLKNLRATEYNAFSLHWFRVPHFCVCSVKTDTCLATVHWGLDLLVRIAVMQTRKGKLYPKQPCLCQSVSMGWRTSWWCTDWSWYAHDSLFGN